MLRTVVASFALLAVAVASSSGCSSGFSEQTQHRPPPQPVASRAASTAIDPLAAGAWGLFRSRRFDLSLPLPDGKAWRIDDHRESWLVAVHDPTGSTLLVRTWREDEVVGRSRCEERARLGRRLPSRQGAQIVESRRIDVPPDHDTLVEAGIVATGAGAPIDGFVMAFGARARRCFAYVFTTRATGTDAARWMAERLSAMVEGSLSEIALKSDLDPSIPREPVR